MSEETLVTFEDENTNDESSNEESCFQFEDYKVSTSPNDFNVQSLVDYVDKGMFVIPGFQRHFVWDIKMASRLIESLLIGLPIPQIFLYEYNKKFLVIDGQQRLMSLYYFKKGRFPKREKRGELREIYQKHNKIPETIIATNDYYQDFKLKLPKKENGEKNKFSNLMYSSLSDLQFNFDMKTIRSITIKQNFPDDNDSSMYEIFNRLNTGGVSLKAQEIRASMYYSKFYEMLSRLNAKEEWRTLLRLKQQDLHMKDIEIILRAMAILSNIESYKHPMLGFLNKYSKQMMRAPEEDTLFLENVFTTFLEKNLINGPDVFFSESGRFIISLFESIFVACTHEAFISRNLEKVSVIPHDKIKRLLQTEEFSRLISYDTTNRDSIKSRIEQTKQLL